jgi:hypothetical protein
MVSKAIQEGLIERIQNYVSNDINSKIVMQDEDEVWKVSPEEVYIVSFTRVLTNWRAYATAERKGAGYYELVHDGLTNKTIVNIFIKHTSNPQQAII